MSADRRLLDEVEAIPTAKKVGQQVTPGRIGRSLSLLALRSRSAVVGGSSGASLAKAARHWTRELFLAPKRRPSVGALGAATSLSNLALTLTAPERVAGENEACQIKHQHEQQQQQPADRNKKANKRSLLPRPAANKRSLPSGNKWPEPAADLEAAQSESGRNMKNNNEQESSGNKSSVDCGADANMTTNEQPSGANSDLTVARTSDQEAADGVRKLQDNDTSGTGGAAAAAADNNKAQSAPEEPEDVGDQFRRLLEDKTSQLLAQLQPQQVAGRKPADEPRCQQCQCPILDEECTEAEGKVWHIHHFCCNKCRAPLGGQQYIMVEPQQPFCLTCFDRVFAKSCAQCSQLISCDAAAVEHDQHAWHASPTCFRCARCARSLLGRPFVPAPGGAAVFCSARCLEAPAGPPRLELLRLVGAGGPAAGLSKHRPLIDYLLAESAHDDTCRQVLSYLHHHFRAAGPAPAEEAALLDRVATRLAQLAEPHDYTNLEAAKAVGAPQCSPAASLVSSEGAASDHSGTSSGLGTAPPVSSTSGSLKSHSPLSSGSSNSSVSSAPAPAAPAVAQRLASAATLERRRRVQPVTELSAADLLSMADDQMPNGGHFERLVRHFDTRPAPASQESFFSELAQRLARASSGPRPPERTVTDHYSTVNKASRQQVAEQRSRFFALTSPLLSCASDFGPPAGSSLRPSSSLSVLAAGSAAGCLQRPAADSARQTSVRPDQLLADSSSNLDQHKQSAKPAKSVSFDPAVKDPPAAVGRPPLKSALKPSSSFAGSSLALHQLQQQQQLQSAHQLHLFAASSATLPSSLAHHFKANPGAAYSAYYDQQGRRIKLSSILKHQPGASDLCDGQPTTRSLLSGALAKLNLGGQSSRGGRREQRQAQLESVCTSQPGPSGPLPAATFLGPPLADLAPHPVELQRADWSRRRRSERDPRHSSRRGRKLRGSSRRRRRTSRYSSDDDDDDDDQLSDSSTCSTCSTWSAACSSASSSSSSTCSSCSSDHHQRSRATTDSSDSDSDCSESLCSSGLSHSSRLSDKDHRRPSSSSSSSDELPSRSPSPVRHRSAGSRARRTTGRKSSSRAVRKRTTTSTSSSGRSRHRAYTHRHDSSDRRSSRRSSRSSSRSSSSKAGSSRRRRRHHRPSSSSTSTEYQHKIRHSGGSSNSSHHQRRTNGASSSSSRRDRSHRHYGPTTHLQSVARVDSESQRMSNQPNYLHQSSTTAAPHLPPLVVESSVSNQQLQSVASANFVPTAPLDSKSINNENCRVV